jgi:hypothetical protein
MAEIDIIRLDILENHQMTKSWKITGDLFGINKASARLIAMGRDPGDNVRDMFERGRDRYSRIRAAKENTD